jgi:hypothetical protein
MAAPVCDWLSRLLPGVGACVNFVGDSERLSHTGTAHEKRMPIVRRLEWEAYVACYSGFPLQGVHRFELPQFLDMTNHLFVAVIT